MHTNHNALRKAAGFIQSTPWRGLAQCFDFHSQWQYLHGYKRLNLDLDLESIYATAQ